MEFFYNTIDTLSKIVCIFGGGLAMWGLVLIGQSHGDQDPASRNTGIKQLVGGGAIVLVGITLVPQLSNIFS